MVMASKADNIIRLIGDAKNIDCQYVKDGDDRVTYIGKDKTRDNFVIFRCFNVWLKASSALMYT